MANQSGPVSNMPQEQTRPLPQNRPLVLGLYGIEGSGKTFFLEQLKEAAARESWTDVEFYEGAEMVVSLIDGGLEAFQNLEESEKSKLREEAIKKISQSAYDSGKMAIVTGRLMFWPTGDEAEQMAYADHERQIFTHIIYLNVPVKTIAHQLRADTKGRSRKTSLDKLRDSQLEKESELRRICRQHRIMFTSLSSPNTELILKLARKLQHWTKEQHEMDAMNVVGRHFRFQYETMQSVLIINGDKTICAEDTATLFWEIAARRGYTHWSACECPLKALFHGPLGSSDAAFVQAMLMYEEIAKFDSICEEVACEVTIYPQFLSLLRKLEHGAWGDETGVVLVTSGLKRVWDIVLEREGLSHVCVVGSGRISDDSFAVTASLKASIAVLLRYNLDLKTWAFGNSSQDLQMLVEANRAIVVVGDESTRSKSMDTALLYAIEHDGLKARQVLLPHDVNPRLNSTILPIMELTDPELLNDIAWRVPKAVHLTDKAAAKLLMTPTLDSAVSGEVLWEAHRRIGFHLATTHLSEQIGLESINQGHEVLGYRLLHEKETCIILLTHEGEPIALGVNDAFPLASLIHAKDPLNFEANHMKVFKNVILVDSIVKSGEFVASFILGLGPGCRERRLFVVAGVVHKEAIFPTSRLAYVMWARNVELVALRCSWNKVIGQGSTNTGNRLLNTNKDEVSKD